MDNGILWITAVCVIFNLALLILVIDNRRQMPDLGGRKETPHLPKASILVPARNEADEIAECLKTLAHQNYPDFEVLVFDDESTDGTSEIVAALANRFSVIRQIPRRPLPAGWMGKNWACHQLAEAASGDLLLFTDADTRHHPDSLQDGVILLNNRSLDLVSAIPQEKLGTWTERLTIPILVWILAALLPQRLLTKIHWPVLSGAIGQYLLFKKNAYHHIGGHQAIRAKVADDFVLARRVKTAGFRTLLADGSDHIQCRMYKEPKAIFLGLGKNLFAVFDHRLLVYSLAWLWLVATAWIPWITILAAWLGSAIAPAAMAASIIAGMASWTAWLIILRRFKLPQYIAVFSPLIVLNGALLAGYSAILYWRGRAEWKDRQLHRKVIS